MSTRESERDDVAARFPKWDIAVGEGWTATRPAPPLGGCTAASADTADLLADLLTEVEGLDLSWALRRTALALRWSGVPVTRYTSMLTVMVPGGQDRMVSCTGAGAVELDGRTIGTTADLPAAADQIANILARAKQDNRHMARGHRRPGPATDAPR